MYSTNITSQWLILYYFHFVFSICLHTLSQATDADPVGAQDFANTIGTNNDTRYKAKEIAGVATDDHPRPEN